MREQKLYKKRPESSWSYKSMQNASQILLPLSLGCLTQSLSGTGFLLSCDEGMESAEGDSIIRLPLTNINVLPGGLVRLR